MNNKFEEAYCSVDKENITVVEAKELHDNQIVIYEMKYKDSFLCPECRKAKLSYVNAKTPYFRTYPNAEHEEDCQMQQDMMDNDEAESFIDNRENKEKVKRQMERLLRMLLTDKDETPKTPLGVNQPVIIRPVIGTGREIVRTKQLPRKRIDIPFTDRDFNCDKLFYGTVKLKWEDGNNDNKKILLYHLTKHNLLCRIKVTSKVYKYIDKKYKSKESFDCAIVFAANFLNNIEKSYQSTSLQYGQLLMLQMMK